MTQSHFLNNRLGEFASDIEKNKVVKDNNKFKHGEIVACIYPHPTIESYTWGICLGPTDPSNNNYNVYMVDHSNVAEKFKKLFIQKISSAEIYRVFGYVEQSYKPNQKLTEEDILETYTIDEHNVF